MPKGLGFKPLGRMLVERKLITPEQWQDCLEQYKFSGKSMAKILVAAGLLSQEELLQAVANQARLPIVDLAKIKIERPAVHQVPASIAQVYNIMPIKLEGNTLTVAISDPLNLEFLDDLRFTLGCNIQAVVATEEQIQDEINKYFALGKESLHELVGQLHKKPLTAAMKQGDKQRQLSPEELQELAYQAPVVKLLNLIILEGVKDKASDIHFEPFGEEFKIRYRIDGQCVEAASPPKDLNLALASRIKVMANLDVTETRLPQDGRILTNIGGKQVDLRVSTLPTVFGESIVMRILDKSVVSLSLDQAGLAQRDKDSLRALIHRPNGIVLVTGPTGSGKTTTLYSCLQEINKIDLNIITAEDPVEYDLGGIIQINIKPKIDLTFAKCLRHILRQDPDVIMVGEIRDKETAGIAIQSALTGHLVFSTLHTNDAPGAITRLLDMEIAPFLITSTISAVLAQRLVRTICPECKAPYQPQEQELSQLGLSGTEAKTKRFYHGKGCPNCKNTGYKGRTGVFEFFVLDDQIRALILEKKSVQALKAAAVKSGMRSLRLDGLDKIYQGITTIEEVVNQTQWFV
ncbi:MAG: type II secretion system ATPase GspE [Candidatus Omnitrophica bacterium]|nr:type II secretion system ATPase GspE [Candidatus Omnitrophota bacterium]